MATHAQGRTAADAAPRPLHNAALLTAASLAAKGCGFVLLLVAARVLGKDGFGEYSQVMAFVGLFAVATDLGLSTLAVRDVAQDRALLPRYVGNVLALRLLLALLAAVACIALAVALRYTAAVRAGIVLWALALVPIAVVGTMGVVFQSIERMAALSVLTAAM
ncbi:MAG TPA: oligosaccharide flippase family protein, partial [Chloroflexota bacterium]|nr:oligosaccharide flippase family protein [Chloroflexota bacterium]